MDKKVTIMGLGLFSVGVGVTKFLISQGADVTVTDLKSAESLTQSLRLLDGLPVKYSLGRHDKGDLANVDLLILQCRTNPDSCRLQGIMVLLLTQS